MCECVRARLRERVREREREGKREREREREGGMQAAGLCLSVQHREPTVLDYSHTHAHTLSHSHTHIHIVMKERFIWTNRVCVRSGGGQQEAHWLTSQQLGQKLYTVCERAARKVHVVHSNT